MIRRLRQVGPPWRYVALFVFAVWALDLLFGGALVINALLMPGSYFQQAYADLYQSMDFGPLRSYVVAVGVSLYAIYRVYAFHPLCCADYRAWLEQGPWNPRLPLPLGPVHLVWQDAVFLGAALLMVAPHGAWSAIYIGCIFLLTYLLLLAVSLRITGQWFLAYPLLWGVAGAIALLPLGPVPALALLAALYGVGCIGLRRAMRDFPWDSGLLDDLVAYFWNVFLRSTRPPSRIPVRARADETPPDADLGWPFADLRPRPARRCIQRYDTVLTSLTLGWIMLLGCMYVPSGNDVDGLGVLALVVVLAVAMSRMGVQAARQAPARGLGARFALRNPLDPTYDVLFLVPLFALLLMVLGVVLAVYLSVFMLPLFLTAALLLLSLGRPVARDWQLTAASRMQDSKLDKIHGDWRRI